jgi:hypothetical protein
MRDARYEMGRAGWEIRDMGYEIAEIPYPGFRIGSFIPHRDDLEKGVPEAMSHTRGEQ